MIFRKSKRIEELEKSVEYLEQRLTQAIDRHHILAGRLERLTEHLGLKEVHLYGTRFEKLK